MPNELAQLLYGVYLLYGVGWKVDLVVQEIGTFIAYAIRARVSAHKAEEARVRACTERDDLLLLRGFVGEKLIDQIVNSLGPDIGSYMAQSKMSPLSTKIRFRYLY